MEEEDWGGQGSIWAVEPYDDDDDDREGRLVPGLANTLLKAEAMYYRN